MQKKSNEILKRHTKMIQFSIEVASEKHIPYVAEFLQTIEEAAKDRGTGIAKRNPE